MARRFRRAAIWQEFGPVGWVLVVIAGLSVWGFAATATRPDWAPQWSGWALTFLGVLVVAVGALGLLVRIRPPKPTPRESLDEIAKITARYGPHGGTQIEPVPWGGQTEPVRHVEISDPILPPVRSRPEVIEAAIREVDERPTKPKGRPNWQRDWRETREALIAMGKPISYRLTGFDPSRDLDRIADVLHQDATEWIDRYWEARKAWWITPLGSAERIANAFSGGSVPGPDWRRALLGQVDAGLAWLERHPGGPVT